MRRLRRTMRMSCGSRRSPDWFFRHLPRFSLFMPCSGVDIFLSGGFGGVNADGDTQPRFFDPTPFLFGKSVRPIFPILQNIGRTVCAFPSWEGQQKMTPPLFWNRYTVRPIFPICPTKPGFPTHFPVFFFPTPPQSGVCPGPPVCPRIILGDGNLIGFRLGPASPRPFGAGAGRIFFDGGGKCWMRCCLRR